MATGAGAYPEPVIPWLSKSRLRLVACLGLLAAFYSASWHLAKVDPAKLLSGLPRMASWTGKAWPPAMDELPVLLQRTGETIAMAAIGTTAAALLALPLSVLAARNVTPSIDRKSTRLNSSHSQISYAVFCLKKKKKKATKRKSNPERNHPHTITPNDP